MDRIEIDLRTTQLTMGELIAEVERRKAANPGREYVMDGDTYAIVSRERGQRCRPKPGKGGPFSSTRTRSLTWM